jgi:integrase
MPRNLNHGKFYQDRNNGPWRIDTHIIIDGKNIHLQKRGFATKHEAQESLESLIQEATEKHAQSKSQSALTFEAFSIEFENHRAKAVCNATTSTNDYYITKKYFHTAFDGMTIAEAFSPKKFLAWYEDLADNSKISAERRNKAIRLAKAMLKYAYGKKYIGPETYQDCDVDCLVLKEPHRNEKERVIWNESERHSFLSAIDTNNPDFVMFSLFLETAPRIGEFLGLTADCFNYQKGYIEIKQQVVYESSNSYTLTDRLKSHQSYRKIPLSQSMADTLNHYIESLGIKPRQFLFGPWANHDVPLSRTEFRRKLDTYCKKAGVQRVNPHGFRHMLSTALSKRYTNTAEIEAGASIMGHSTSVELNIYCHNNTLDNARALLKEATHNEA